MSKITPKRLAAMRKRAAADEREYQRWRNGQERARKRQMDWCVRAEAAGWVRFPRLWTFRHPRRGQFPDPRLLAACKAARIPVRWSPEAVDPVGGKPWRDLFVRPWVVAVGPDVPALKRAARDKVYRDARLADALLRGDGTP